METGVSVAHEYLRMSMTASQQRREWFRLAFAATAFALLVMLIPQERSASARASAFITLSPAPTCNSLAARWARWEWPAVTHATSTDCVAFSAILPVLFVGLMAPLALAYIGKAGAGLPPAAPFLATLFQRPPPAQAR
jgi:hypothetical protein